MTDQFYISTDNSMMDFDFIHGYLSNESYWAKDRSLETVKTSIKNSMCFGVFEGDRQIGFARVVTDYAVFAWILDVFIIDDYQRGGLGKRLISEIVNHPDLQGLQRWGLNTLDAHALYRQFGFKEVVQPEVYMEIRPQLS